MRFEVHVAIAFAAAAFSVIALEKLSGMTIASNFVFLAQIAAVTALGAALPDVDQPNTRQFKLVAAFVAVSAFALARAFLAQRFPEIGSFEAAAYAFVAALAALGFVYVAKPRHRGFTHSFAALAVFATGVFALTQSVQLAGFASLAFATHLAADAEFKIL